MKNLIAVLTSRRDEKRHHRGAMGDFAERWATIYAEGIEAGSRWSSAAKTTGTVTH